MRVVDVEHRQIVHAAGSRAGREAGWLIFYVGLTALLMWIAAVGLAGIPVELLWFAAGAVAADSVNSVRGALTAWLAWRRVRRCATCRTVVAESNRAWVTWRKCARVHGRAGGAA